MNHELLLPGHLITMYVKEKLEDIFVTVRQEINREYRKDPEKTRNSLRTTQYFSKQFDRHARTVGGKIGTFLSTGNIISSTGLDLMQVSGYTIVAERLNIFRYMSHFQVLSFLIVSHLLNTTTHSLYEDTSDLLTSALYI